MCKEDGWLALLRPRLDCQHILLEPDQVHYCEYLSLGTLFSLVKPNAANAKRRDPLHPDEALFVTVHQVFELLFAQHIFELLRVRDSLCENLFQDAHEILIRVIKLTRHYSLLMGLLGTMSRDHFGMFRGKLAPASGFESEGFRLIEIYSGMREDSPYVVLNDKLYTYREFLDQPPSTHRATCLWTPRMTQACSEGSIYDAFRRALTKHDVEPESVGHLGHLLPRKVRSIALSLAAYEEALLGFRRAHRDIVEYQIGYQEGTARTAGVAYLDSVIVTARLFPDLKVGSMLLESRRSSVW